MLNESDTSTLEGRMEANREIVKFAEDFWLRGRDLNPRPLGYEPNELPDCSTPRQENLIVAH